jgi:hypothetical protein
LPRVRFQPGPSGVRIKRKGIAIIWRVFTDSSPTSPLYDGRPDQYRYDEISDRDMFNVPGFNSSSVVALRRTLAREKRFLWLSP